MDKPEFAANPWPELAAARAQHPWLASCAFGYVVHQFGAMKDLLWRDDHLETGIDHVLDIMGAQGTEWGRFEKYMLLVQQGDSHRRIRDALAPAFTPRQVNKHRDLMREVVTELLDDWVPKGEFDFEDFAANFPVGVMCILIGASRDVIPEIRASLEALGRSFSLDPAHLPALEAAMVKMGQFVRQLVADRRAKPLTAGKTDLLTSLMEIQQHGVLSEQELYDNLIFLFIAGYDTSKNALTLLMSALIDRPEIYERCAVDKAYCRRVVEENFRFLTTSTIPRMVTKDIEYRDVLIPAGTQLYFPVSISGRDPTEFEDPDSFTPSRRDIKRHLTFGMGRHICLGQFLARAQIEEGLHLIAQCMKHPRRTGPSQWRPFFGVWGLEGLPIEFG